MMRSKQFRKPDLFYEAFLIIIFVGFASVVVGCSLMAFPQNPVLVDRSFITGQPCAPPCWYGLELDLSTEKDVYDTLENLPFVDQATIVKWYPIDMFGYSGMTEIHYPCTEMKGEMCGNIFLLDGLVKVITLNVRYDLALEAVVAQLGPPEYMKCSRAMQQDILSLDWPDKKISVRIYERSLLCSALDNGARLDPNLNIGTVSYISQDVFTKSGCNTGDCSTWPGFQEK